MHSTEPHSLANARAPMEMGRNTAASEPATVLVIEDDPSLRRILCDVLREEEYRVMVAGNGDEGLELAVQHRPRAVLLDLGLPVMSGWEVIRQLRASERTGCIPVIVLTAVSGPAFAMKGQHADAVVSKPFDLTVLLDHLADVLQPTNLNGEAATGEPVPQKTLTV